MDNSFVLCFLYNTVFGRMILKLLVHPNVSKFAGCLLSSGASKWIIPYFIQKNEIDMSDIEIPKEGFSSFNEFFTRKRKLEGYNLSDDDMISPCDGFLTIKKINEDTVFKIKNTHFSVKDLLKDNRFAEKYKDGTALIFRLTPANYHRYCYISDGRIIHYRKIRGLLHCVRPIALRNVPVFIQNSREYQVIKTKTFGTIIQMEIGALLVGKIRNYKQPLGTKCIRAGEEKGYFEFGGSTIIVLLKKEGIRFNKKLFEKRDVSGEIPVRMGDVIAKCCDKIDNIISLLLVSK